MKKIPIRPALAVLGAAAFLAACGGGGGGGGGFNTGPINNPTSELPASATDSSSGLVAYLRDLIANRTDNTSEPVILGTAVLPKDDTGGPEPVN